MKAQISMEFITFLGIMLIFLVLASYAAITSSRDIATENEIKEARRIASLVVEEINLAVEVGDGYKHRFSLPPLLYGNLNYTVNLSQRLVRVEWRDRVYSLPVLAHNITGPVRNGINIIKNVNGAIVFE